MLISRFFSFFRSFVKWFITFMPFYYAPFLFISDVYGSEWAALRVAKDFVILFILVLWSIYFIKNGSCNFLKTWTSLLVFLYVFYGLLIIITLNEIEIIIEVSRIYIIYPFWFFMAKSLYASRTEVQLQLNRWILVSVIVSVIGISEWLFIGGDNIYSRAAGQTRSISTLFSPNALGWYLVVMNSLLLGMIKFNSRIPNDSKGYFSYSTALSFFLINTIAIVLSGSRSALLVNILIISSWLLFRFYKRKVAVSLGFFIILSFISYFAIPFQSGFDELRVFGGVETSRFDIYSEMLESYWRMDISAIIFGLGVYEYSMLKQSGLLDDSYLLTVVASGGILSIFIFASIVISGFVNFFTSRKYFPQERASIIYLFSACCILGLIGNLQGIFPLAIFFWLAFGMLIQMNAGKLD